MSVVVTREHSYKQYYYQMKQFLVRSAVHDLPYGITVKFDVTFLLDGKSIAPVTKIMLVVFFFYWKCLVHYEFVQIITKGSIRDFYLQLFGKTRTNRPASSTLLIRLGPSILFLVSKVKLKFDRAIFSNYCRDREKYDTTAVPSQKRSKNGRNVRNDVLLAEGTTNYLNQKFGLLKLGNSTTFDGQLHRVLHSHQTSSAYELIFFCILYCMVIDIFSRWNFLCSFFSWDPATSSLHGLFLHDATGIFLWENSPGYFIIFFMYLWFTEMYLKSMLKNSINMQCRKIPLALYKLSKSKNNNFQHRCMLLYKNITYK